MPFSRLQLANSASNCLVDLVDLSKRSMLLDNHKKSCLSYSEYCHNFTLSCTYMHNIKQCIRSKILKKSHLIFNNNI